MLGEESLTLMSVGMSYLTVSCRIHSSTNPGQFAHV